eukprot:TRINITY_DN27864_c0_g1_i1.p1 TRINITY_DN27864_c0_g1~~TRINITY_DN27864_c0_g1_i1.p1  ORF type:complete len:634 (+),score=148.10 TRINITY_DN27864_c0_g1_i1:47-1903(+)
MPHAVAAVLALYVPIVYGVSDQQPDVNSECLEAVLDGYEYSAAPPTRPVHIQLSMDVTQLTDFTASDESFRVIVYFRQTWTDERLAWDPAAHPNCPDLHRDIDGSRLWMPDAFFVSAVEIDQLDDAESYMLNHTGEIRYSRRLVLRFVCPMDFTYFPFDTQTCRSRVESYGYSVADIRFTDGSFTVLPGALASSEYALRFDDGGGGLEGFETCITDTCYPAAEVVWVFPSSGSVGMIVALHVVVAVSFLGCAFVDKRSTDARIALTIFMILTLMTSLAAMRETLPNEPSYTAVDIVYFVTMVAVLMNAVEFCIVNVLLVAIDRQEACIAALKERRAMERERGVCGQPPARIPSDLDVALAKAELLQTFLTFDPRRCGRIHVKDFVTLIHAVAYERGRSFGHAALVRALLAEGVRAHSPGETVTIAQAEALLVNPQSRVAIRAGLMYECRAATSLWAQCISKRYNPVVTDWHLGCLEGWYRCWAPLLYIATNLVWFVAVKQHATVYASLGAGAPVLLAVAALARWDWVRRFSTAFVKDTRADVHEVKDDGLSDGEGEGEGKGGPDTPVGTGGGAEELLDNCPLADPCVLTHGTPSPMSALSPAQHSPGAPTRSESIIMN